MVFFLSRIVYFSSRFGQMVFFLSRIVNFSSRIVYFLRLMVFFLSCIVYRPRRIIHFQGAGSRHLAGEHGSTGDLYCQDLPSGHNKKSKTRGVSAQSTSVLNLSYTAQVQAHGLGATKLYSYLLILLYHYVII